MLLGILFVKFLDKPFVILDRLFAAATVPHSAHG
jgi:hypothetical protein